MVENSKIVSFWKQKIHMAGFRGFAVKNNTKQNALDRKIEPQQRKQKKTLYNNNDEKNKTKMHSQSRRNKGTLGGIKVC